MKLKAYKKPDVLVMGAGLAGIMAAITAAEQGADVCLVSPAGICSGSSFYPGTWGLGLIGPEDEGDISDLEETILHIGEHMADPSLVHTLAVNITEGIAYLEQMGVRLKKAEQKGEREFIPCFDHKNRAWNGITQDSAREVFKKRLNELNVTCLPDTEVISCVMKEDRVAGAITLDKDSVIQYISCKSLIIASGGLGGLFQYRLNTDDIQGMGQYLALEAGASLVNIEFMQMMPGFLKPAPKTIYNEKIFRYSEFCYPETRTSVFEHWDEKETQRLLELRSGHGPFTTRIESGKIDERLFEEFLKDNRGVTVTYREAIWQNQPEFVRNYFEWLEQEKHLTVRDAVNIGIFAHASNGGIKIGSSCETDVPGLFACGEVTGGMHGADRLGGLSTANGLVFGRIAGKAAAEAAKACGMIIEETEFVPQTIKDASRWLEIIREMNFKAAMVNRSEDSATAGLALLYDIENSIQSDISPVSSLEKTSYLILRDTYRLKAAIILSKCLLSAIRLRKESRGSHHRTDYTRKDDKLNTRIICSFSRDIHISYEQ